MRSSVVGAAILLASSGAFAAGGKEPPVQEDARQEKKICRTEKMTGSLTRSRRICMTRAQWDQVYRRTKQGFDEVVSKASGGCQAPTDPSKGTMC